jgi:hypothetical protein
VFGKKAKQSADRELLETLAPVIGGEVGDEGHLRGAHHGQPVDAWFEHIYPTPMMHQHGAQRAEVDVISLRLPADGGVPWYVRSEPTLNLRDEHNYEFIREDGQHAFGRLSPFADMIATPDPAVEARLQQAGLLDAITRIAPAADFWLPRVRFTPDPRAAMMARFQASGAAANLPAAASQPSGTANVGLMVDVSRGLVELTPDGFAALLDAVCAVVELNGRVNPAQ